VLLITAVIASAQAGFRVSHTVARTLPTHVEVAGSVVNEARADAVDVSVTVEAIGAGGKVLARGITFVASRIPENATAPFSAKIPVVQGVTGYRATVTTYRFVQNIQGP
jgi:hypothetical protein